MKNEQPEFQCPLCGHPIPRTTPVDRRNLRALMMGELLPAIAHTLNHHIENLEAYQEIIQSDADPSATERLREILYQTRQTAGTALQSLRTLLILAFPVPAPQAIAGAAIAELPENIQKFLEASHFPAHVDTGPLQHSPYWLSPEALLVYMDAFSFAIQGALIAIRRDRQPTARAEFELLQKQLKTRITLTHKSPPQEKPVQWKALEWLVSAAGGTVNFQAESTSTVLEWTVTLPEPIRQ
jgi:hypothetical protein